VQILKIFNNNVVPTLDELGREVVITGRGVGYQARPGDPIDPALIVRWLMGVADGYLTRCRGSATSC